MLNLFNPETQSYLITFGGYIQQFLHWGLWLFYSLLLIQIVWLTLWYAFDHSSFVESVSAFIKRFFTITFFYTLMINPNWFIQALKTALFMGTTLVNIPLDPSSLIASGIAIGNKILMPFEQTHLLDSGVSLIIMSAVYFFTQFVFVSLAIDLSATLIISTLLVSVATFFLSFAALEVTTPIAYKTLNSILGNCAKLLGLYLVIGVGSQMVLGISEKIPTKVISFDPYVWLIAELMLIWVLSKKIPKQFSQLFSMFQREYK